MDPFINGAKGNHRDSILLQMSLTRAEEKACIPTPELSGVDDSSGILGCPGILPAWWGGRRLNTDVVILEIIHLDHMCGCPESFYIWIPEM